MQKTKKKISSRWISLIIAAAVIISIIGGTALIKNLNKNPHQKVFEDYISAAKKQDVEKIAETMYERGSDEYDNWVYQYKTGKEAYEDFLAQNSFEKDGEIDYSPDYYDFLAAEFDPTDDRDYGLLLSIESRIASLVESFEFKLDREDDYYSQYTVSLIWPDSNFFNPNEYPAKYKKFISNDEFDKSYELGFKRIDDGWYFVSPFTLMKRAEAIDTWYAPYEGGVELKHVNPKDIQNGTYTVALTSEGDPIISIGDYAFSQCGTDLKRVVLSEDVKNIGKYAFLNCTELFSVSYSDEAVQSAETDKERDITVGEGAFMNCALLESFTLPKKNTIIPSYLFYGSGIKAFEIYDTVTAIGHRAFANCLGLTKINIDDNIKIIGDAAFSGCRNLREINSTNTFSENLSRLGANAFRGCESLETINFSSGIRILELGTFSDCKKLASITLPDTLKTIGQYVFSSTALTSIELPKSVENIGAFAFANCQSLANVVWSEQTKIKTIGTSAFNGCASLYEFTIPETVSEIGQSAFSGCTGLRLVRINCSGNISLGANAFEMHDGIPKLYVSQEATFKNNTNWYGLEIYSQDIIQDDFAILTQTETDINGVTSEEKILVQYLGDDANVDLTNSQITKIGSGAFSFNTHITNVTFDSTKIKSIGANAFEGCNESIFTQYTSALANSTLLYIENWLIKTKAKYESRETLDLTQANTLLFRNSAGTVDMPETYGIASNAFERSNAVNVTLPSSLVYLGENAFAYSINIESVQIESGSKLKSIGAGAFLSCELLTNISIPNEVALIGARAFDACTNLRYVKINSQKIKLEANVFRPRFDVLKIYIQDYDTSTFYQENADWVAYRDISYDLDIINGDFAIKDSTLVQYLGLEKNLPIIDLNDHEISKIEKGAFATSGVYSVIIPSYIEIIENYAFYNCKSLTLLTFEADNGENSLMRIGDYAFSGCSEIGGLNGNVVMEASAPNAGFTMGTGVFDGDVTRKVNIELRANYIFENSYWNNYETAIRAANDPTIKIVIDVIGGDGTSDNRVNGYVGDREYESTPRKDITFTATADVANGYRFVGWYDEEGNLVEESETLRTEFGEERQDNPPTYIARFEYIAD